MVENHEIDTILMTNLYRIGRDALKVLAVLEEFDSHGIKLIIQGGDTVEIEDNPLLKFLHRFISHPSLEVVLASTTE
ncbi:MAG TPA: recombinase family protein [Candidatus Scatomorpha merdigallinarum]|nr:recombinase family protein [Candidatus Scatomorpha merdigallinarum]